MILFKPLVVGGVTQPFTTLEFPEACALAETSKITGSYVAECGELKPAGTYVGGNCATHRVTQLLKPISAALAKTLGDTMKFGANEMSPSGVVAVEFGSPCKGCSWGGDAA
jgi:hypothetical protein